MKSAVLLEHAVSHFTILMGLVSFFVSTFFGDSSSNPMADNCLAKLKSSWICFFTFNLNGMTTMFKFLIKSQIKNDTKFAYFSDFSDLMISERLSGCSMISSWAQADIFTA